MDELSYKSFKNLLFRIHPAYPYQDTVVNHKSLNHLDLNNPLAKNVHDKEESKGLGEEEEENDSSGNPLINS